MVSPKSESQRIEGHDSVPINRSAAGLRFHATALVAATIFATLFFLLWPGDVIYDDGAIILKYMDNFAKGYFYSYNPADGPCFGISGFIHGILAGSFAYTQLLSPLNSLFASNFIGLMLVSLISLLILRHFISDYRIVYPSWLLLMFSSPNFVGTVKQGLEAPLHLGIILLFFYSFLLNRPKWMWMTGVLAIISKLDAFPIVTALTILFTLRLLRSEGKIPVRYHLKTFLLYGMAPGLIWLVFTILVFGSPIPRTAITKFFYHGHATGAWFPFLRNWYQYSSVMILASGSLFIAYAIGSRLLKDAPSCSKVLSFGFGALTYLGLYVFYNPGEQMPWYYAVPEFLLILQTLVAAAILLRNIVRKAVLLATVSVLLIFAFCFLPPALKRTGHILLWLSRVEPELIEVGRWVRDHSTPNETLMAGLGHVARESRLYTVDASGLNSRSVTDCWRRKGIMYLELPTDWLVVHGLIHPWVQYLGNYELVTSFYRIATMRGQCALRVYRRVLPEHSLRGVAIALDKKHIRTDGNIPNHTVPTIVEGTSMVFANPFMVNPSHLLLCVLKREEPVRVTASVCGDRLNPLNKQTVRLEAADLTDAVYGVTQELRIDTNIAQQRIGAILLEAESESTAQPVEVTVIEPVFVLTW